MYKLKSSLFPKEKLFDRLSIISKCFSNLNSLLRHLASLLKVFHNLASLTWNERNPEVLRYVELANVLSLAGWWYISGCSWNIIWLLSHLWKNRVIINVLKYTGHFPHMTFASVVFCCVWNRQSRSVEVY